MNVEKSIFLIHSIVSSIKGGYQQKLQTTKRSGLPDRFVV